MKRRLLILATSTLLLLFGSMSASNRPANIYPFVEVEVVTTEQARNSLGEPQWLRITYLLDPVLSEKRCESLTGNIARVMLEKCPYCAVKQLKCPTSLDSEQQQALSNAPLDSPSGRMNNGVIVYRASPPELAQIACDHSATQSLNAKNPITCFKSDVARPRPREPMVPIGQMAFSLLALFSALSASWLCCWLIVKYEHLHAHLSHDHTDAGPQKFHATPTPRVGGLGLAAGLIAAGSTMIVITELQYPREFGLLLLAGTPAFLGGLVEDITKKVGVLERLLLTMLSGAAAAWLLGATIDRLDAPLLDEALMIPAVAITFTIFAVGGVANAINIIDGFNGLAGGFSIIVLAAIAWVAAMAGDDFIFSAALALAGAVLGFLVWNWPCGRIFLGDGGAYLLGFILAELSILLVMRNPTVSPWFALLLLIYPVFETFYSMYRRKIRAGSSPGLPDGMHLHQLIYKRIAVNGECRLAHNSRVAKYLWFPIAILATAGSALSHSTEALSILSIGFCAVYVVCYKYALRTRGQREAVKQH